MNTESPSRSVILASSSKYRKLLLQRFDIAFACIAPEIDESALTGESPAELVRRLAACKADVIATLHPQAIVIGSDQLAVFNGEIMGKPGQHDVALKQLLAFSGQIVEFLTSLSVVCRQSGYAEHYIDRTQVHFRTLQAAEIERYLRRETPYDCAGAFKAEALGIVLFEKIISDDPTALTGLPLIQTAAMLRRAGLSLP